MIQLLNNYFTIKFRFFIEKIPKKEKLIIIFIIFISGILNIISPFIADKFAIADSQIYSIGLYNNFSNSVVSLISNIPIPIFILINFLIFIYSQLLVLKFLQILNVRNNIKIWCLAFFNLPVFLFLRSYPSKELVVFFISTFIFGIILNKNLNFLFKIIFLVFFSFFIFLFDRSYSLFLLILSSFLVYLFFLRNYFYYDYVKLSKRLNLIFVLSLFFLLIILIDIPLTSFSQSIDQLHGYLYALQATFSEGGTSSRNFDIISVNDYIYMAFLNTIFFTQFLPNISMLYRILNFHTFITILIVFRTLILPLLIYGFFPDFRNGLGKIMLISYVIFFSYPSFISFYSVIGGWRLISGDWLFMTMILISLLSSSCKESKKFNVI